MTYKYIGGPPEYAYRKSPKFKANVADHESIIPPRSFDEYKERLAPAWELNRTEDGILTAKWWTQGKEMQYGVGAHRGWSQLFQEVHQDPDTEVLIIGGWGDVYLKGMLTKMADERANMPWWAYEHMYCDGTDYMEALVNLRIPTIGVINGFAPHSEVALLCDITIMAEDAVIVDPHFGVGGIPGDGIQLVLQKLLGIKRANYAMATMQKITAQQALEWGLVSEVLPRDKIYERAQELAQGFMQKDRQMRRLTSEIFKEPWREHFAKYLRTNFAREMWSFFFNDKLDHDSASELMPKDEGAAGS
ncbi:MAG: enoyl-CoA hydratase/isomerase family protein [Pseudoxanthomonas sp.]